MYTLTTNEVHAVANTVTTREGQRMDPTNETLVVDETQITHAENRSNPQPGDPAPTLNQAGHTIAFNCQQDPDSADVALPLRGQADVSVFQEHGTSIGPMGTLTAGTTSSQGVPFEISTGSPRRLTPRECERLQGFPDDWTRYDAEGAELADSPRYRLVGNAVAVPVAEWIGRRIIDQAARSRRGLPPASDEPESRAGGDSAACRR